MEDEVGATRGKDPRARPAGNGSWARVPSRAGRSAELSRGFM